MNNQEYERERRRQKRLGKLGTNDPHCSLCGEGDDRMLELHHIAGRQHDDALAIVCRNCHRVVSDDQKDHPAFDPAADPELASIGHFLLGLADMLRVVIVKLNEFACTLIDRSRSEGGAA
jgi:hypothetical protein